MAGAVPIRTKKEASFPAVLELRRVRAKLDLFSPGVILFSAVVLVLAALFTFDSYLKSCRNAQTLQITTQVEKARFENFRKTDLETQYLRLVSAPALVRYAGDLKMRPATKDRLLPL